MWRLEIHLDIIPGLFLQGIAGSGYARQLRCAVLQSGFHQKDRDLSVIGAGRRHGVMQNTAIVRGSSCRVADTGPTGSCSCFADWTASGLLFSDSGSLRLHWVINKICMVETSTLLSRPATNDREESHEHRIRIAGSCARRDNGLPATTPVAK
jgi:hypothetical protein